MNGAHKRTNEQIEEILSIRGPQDGLACREDVVAFAVNELYAKVSKSRAAELYRSLTWRENSNAQKKFQEFCDSKSKVWSYKT